MINNISIEKLQHHPLNPRVNIENIEELSESLKANGFIQNMTVCPSEDSDCFYVIVGNRRLEAARLAGIKECPCEVVALSEDEVVAMMMQENMLRADFTVYEEAQGFQQMLDLGCSVEQIAKGSGFSESTIRRRTKIAKLDKEKFKAAVDKGANLFELEKLADVKDEEERDKILAKFGTKDYRNALETARHREETNEYFTMAIAYCEGLGAKKADGVAWEEGFRTIRLNDESFRVNTIFSFKSYEKNMPAEDFKAPNNEPMYYYVESYSVVLYQQLSEEQLTTIDLRKQRREALENICSSKVEEMNEISERFKKMRDNFIINYSVSKKASMVIREFAVKTMLNMALEKRYDTMDFKEFQKFCGGEDVDIFAIYKDVPDYVTLLVTYKVASENTSCCTNAYDSFLGHGVPSFKQNDKLIALYSWLDRLGYEISSEENQFITGTHPVFDTSWSEEYREKVAA